MAMNRKTIGIALAGIAVVALVLAFGGGDDGSAAGEAPQGTPAPEVSFTYFDGSQGTLADLRGKPVILNFWASWCPACVAEMPGFQRVYEQFGDRLTILGLDVQDTRDAAEALVERTGVQYPLGDDPDGTLLQTFGGIAMPTTVFIDADGNVLDSFSGFLTEDLLSERIQTLFFGG